MPASTFPTRSAPTSAPFVKIPPPNRAKTEIKLPPNAKLITNPEETVAIIDVPKEEEEVPTAIDLESIEVVDKKGKTEEASEEGVEEKKSE